MSSSFKELHTRFVRSVGRTAKQLKKSEWQVTKGEFVAHDTEGFTEWDLRKGGGFASLMELCFPNSSELEVQYGSRLLKQYAKRLERDHGHALFFEKELHKAVKDILAEVPITLHKPVKLQKPRHGSKRTIVASVSDTHFGANISKEEMHGLNEFNWTLASRRLALFMEQIVHYKIDHRKDTDLVIQLNGDIIAGQIHNQEWFVDLLTTQFAGTVSILSQAISYVAQHFHKVTVVCTPGNHGRNVGKADKSRATVHKWDSYENMIYISLREIFAERYKNVEFLIPEAPYIVYKVQGHYVFQTHGDTVINVGNPGKSLNMDSITNQINQIISSDLIKFKEKISVVSVGHVHTPTIQILQNGCALMINGCLSGIDPFAQSIGIFSNNPTQVLYESTDKHSVGDIRMIQLKTADSNQKYDSIIKPFQKSY